MLSQDTLTYFFSDTHQEGKPFLRKNRQDTFLLWKHILPFSFPSFCFICFFIFAIIFHTQCSISIISLIPATAFHGNVLYSLLKSFEITFTSSSSLMHINPANLMIYFICLLLISIVLKQKIDKYYK